MGTSASLTNRRVLHVDLGREFRGGQRQVLMLAERQARSGMGVAVAAPRKAELLTRAKEAGLTTFALPGRFEFNPLVFAVVRAAIKQVDAELVHTHDSRAASVGALIRHVPPVRFRLVHSRRVSYPLKPGFSTTKYRMADAVIAVSGEIAEQVRAAGVDPAHVHVVHSGIETERFADLPRTTKATTRTVGIVGALTPQKGVEVYLRALARLVRWDGHAEVRGVVVGDGQLRDELQALATRLGIGEAVTFTGWQDSATVLGNVDVLCVPSVDGEGSSATIKEGWAARVPVVASNLSSNRELVEDGVHGLVTPVGDDGALAEALARLLADAPLRHRLQTGGAVRLTDFTADAMAAGNMAVYAGLFARAGKGD